MIINGIKVCDYTVCCSNLTDPGNGTMTCSLGDDGVPSYEDTCSFTCNSGYKLTGSGDTRTCQSDGSWSGNETNCSESKYYIYMTVLYYTCLSQILFME